LTSVMSTIADEPISMVRHWYRISVDFVFVCVLDEP
jgi:hypothetical protein